MKPSAWVGAACAWLVAASLSSGACGGESSPGETSTKTGTTTAGTGGAGGAPDAWTTSACGACVLETCAGPDAACKSDPECAAFLTCLYACPPTAEGSADPACEAACPAPLEAAGAQALADWRACRTASSCPCAASECPHPVLCQDCPELPPDTKDCETCFETACCESVAACDAGSECYDIRVCIGSCPQTSAAEYWDCEIACGDAHPTGYAPFRELTACIPYHCAKQCAPLAAGCLECMNEHCAAERTACWADVECSKIMGCSAHCSATDSACIAACRDQHPAAGPAFDAMIGCTVASCSGPC